jgi:uncharacterized protein YjiS (DUF1127 family)
MIRNIALPLEPSAFCYSAVRDYLVAASAQIRCWYNVYRQRHALLALNDAMLKDIGLSRVDALAEGSKPFWRP